MDVIKTSLIIAIGITFYYLLLQWPNQVDNYEVSTNYTNESIEFDDSEDLLTEPLSPLSEQNEIQIESATQPLEVFEIENDDLSLFVEKTTGKFTISFLKNISLEKGGEDPFVVLDPNNSYSANSGFYTRSQGYLKPNFSKISESLGVNGKNIYTLEGETNGISFKKKIEMDVVGYGIKIFDEITSTINDDITVTPYVLIERDNSPVKESGLMYTYLGPVFSSTRDTYEKYDFDDIKDAPYQNKTFGGWVAFIQHYFLTAWIPDQSAEHLYQARYNESRGKYSVGYTSKDSILSYGGKAVSSNVFYVGPKLPKQLANIEENLDLTVDYGFLWWLGKPMYWLLDIGYGIFQNWGLAIIFLTVILKIATWPLSAKAYVSMGKMRELAPKMQQLQEKHGDNRQAMSQELMEIYKKEGVNPLGGCLPMLAQMPFFLAFYWVLLETVELRHSPFFLWIDDLSAMDPYYVLPLLNGAGMYLSQKLTPTPPNADPMQAQMMKLFPLIFAVIFAWFPSGLVLYWLVNMVIQIFQQWWYTRKAAASKIG